MAKKKLNFIDLFSGCGGFSTGLEAAGHRCLLGVDFNKDAVNTFAKNHKKAHALHMDIHKLTKTKIEQLIDVKNVDMVVGGPPCQGFSTVGRGHSDDERNNLFKQFVRIVRICSPKIVLFENVTGMLAKKNEKTLKSVFREFEKLGYHMDARVLSAEEYGVPSKRRRTILMGVKEGIPTFPEITHGKRGASSFIPVKKVIKDLKTLDKKIYNHNLEQTTIKNDLDLKRLKCIPSGGGIRYERDELAYLPKRLRYDVDWTEIRENRFRQTKLQRLALDQPAPTILTSRTMYYHPTEPRYLTCREAARFQSFPNDFIFEGSQTAIFRQIGNAVPPVMAQALGDEVRRIFNRAKTKSKKKVDHNFKEKAFTYSDHTFA